MALFLDRGRGATLPDVRGSADPVASVWPAGADYVVNWLTRSTDLFADHHPKMPRVLQPEAAALLDEIAVQATRSRCSCACTASEYASPESSTPTRRSSPSTRPSSVMEPETSCGARDSRVTNPSISTSSIPQESLNR